jgi:hypothetical protein
MKQWMEWKNIMPNKKATNKIKTRFQLFKAQHFYDKKLEYKDYLIGQYLFDSEGASAAIRYISQCVPAYDLRVPCKCHVIAASRPLLQWDVVSCNKSIQKFIYAKTKEEVEAIRCELVPSKKERQKREIACSDKARYAKWFTRENVDNAKIINVQLLNAMFKKTIGIYNGVEKKVDNRNKKRVAKLASKNKSRQEKGLPTLEADPPEEAYGEDGKLLQPPGVNPTIYCVQNCNLKAYAPKQLNVTLGSWIATTTRKCNKKKDKDAKSVITEIVDTPTKQNLVDVLKTYARKSTDPILPLVPKKRLLTTVRPID